MKQRIIGFLVAVAVATVVVLVFVRPDEAATPGSRTDTAPAIDTAPADGIPTAVAADSTTGGVSAEAPGPPNDALLAEVTRLADGDSFEVSWLDEPPESVWRDEVRMLGINAPEGNACFGTEARDVLASLIVDDLVLVDIAEHERDDFGRAIADVWNTDGLLLNVAMVERGAALALSGDGPNHWLITDAQRMAQATGSGLWSSCRVSAAEVVIADLLADAPGRDDLNPNGEWVEIANVGDEAVDLTGWGIRDESTRHRFSFPAGYALGPGDVVRIGSGCESDERGADVDLHWCAEDPVWNNGGDTVFLVDPDGRFADEWSYSG